MTIALLGKCRRISEVMRSTPGDFRGGRRLITFLTSAGEMARGGRRGNHAHVRNIGMGLERGVRRILRLSLYRIWPQKPYSFSGERRFDEIGKAVQWLERFFEVRKKVWESTRSDLRLWSRES